MSIAYVGCRTTAERNARGKGISVYHVDDATGAWTLLQILEDLVNPSFLCFDNEQRFLYTVHGDGTTASSFAIDADGRIHLLNTVPIGGRNPVFLTPDADNSFIYVASLQGGAVAVCRRLPDGSLSEPIHMVHLEGKAESGVSHAHQCVFDPSGAYLLVPTQGRRIGYGGVFVFRKEPDGALTRTDRWLAREHDEPRHLIFHPNGRFAYLLNEHGNCVTFFHFDRKTGTLEAKQIVSTLPETWTKEGWASELCISPDGRYLYASNRSHDSVAQLSVDPHTGYMRFLECTPCLGRTPRFMTLTPDGSYLLVANEDSDTIRIFSLDPEDGRLSFTGYTVETGSPTCILWK